METYNSKHCRICMKVDGFISVFDKLNDKPIVTLIFETFDVKIENAHQDAPSKCCGNCLQNLMAAVDLKKSCLASNQIISKYFIVPAERIRVFEKVTVIEPIKDTQEPKEFHIKIESQQITHESNDVANLVDDDSQDSNNATAEHTDTSLKDTESDILNPPRKYTKTAQSESDVPTKCRFCSKEFISQKRAMIHEEKLHLLEKDFICDLCGKAYVYKSMVETHIKKFHLKIKNFSCEICGFAMYSKGDYFNHRKIHDPDALKNFSCEICSKKFTKRYNLMCHTRSHTKEKAFSCNICSERFVHKSTFRRHLAKHNREYKFNCGVCSKSFYNRNTMLTHELRHNKEKKPRKSRRKVNQI